jgi:hypothetical protein
MRKLEHQAQQGFVTIAQNGKVNYLQLAYMQAMSIKLTMPTAKYAVIVDNATRRLISNKHLEVFDYVITIEDDGAKDEEWKLSNEWQVFYLTPFKETIKLESDLVFTRSIEHWWTAFRLRNIVLSQGCRDYLQNISSSRAYRKLFDDNELPDVYNGLMYFRYSQESSEFFNYARIIFKNWEYIRDHVLKNCRDENPTTDVVYALASKILGVEHCTLPGLDFINFTHMKSLINGFSQQVSWQNVVVSETELPMIRINNVNQYHPLHYYEKDWVNDELIKEYEYELGRRVSKGIQ